jgi:hypothetical protein
LAFCRCCFISAIPPGASHTDRPVLLCDECGLHYGNTEKTVLAHERMMETYRDANAKVLERLDERRLAVVAELVVAQGRVDELTAAVASDYRRGLVSDVRGIVEEKVVTDASVRETAARRARDRAMAMVQRIDELHHENGETCSCGKRITLCSEFALLAPFRDELHSWEARQRRTR